MHVIIAAIGTGGDVLPFVGLGRALATRGHRVTLLANEHFEPWAGQQGLDFVPAGTTANYHDAIDDPLLALKLLDARGIFLTRYPEQIPPGLPATVRHFGYLPLSNLLTEAAAIVHHGGIGTTSQALAAGVPQLVAPMVHDQHDNGHRVAGFGVGDTIDHRRYTAGRVAPKIGRLLASRNVEQSCRKTRDLIAGQNGIGAWCDAVENLRTT